MNNSKILDSTISLIKNWQSSGLSKEQILSKWEMIGWDSPSYGMSVLKWIRNNL